jgi:hypothetical protein
MIAGYPTTASPNASGVLTTVLIALAVQAQRLR